LFLLNMMVGVPSVLWADEKPAPIKRINRGVELIEAGKVKEAVYVWEEVLPELSGKALTAVHLYLGLGYKELKQWPEAWHHLTSYLKTNDTVDPETGKDLQSVEKELAGAGYVKVGVVCQPVGARLSVGARDYACPLTWWFQPGKEKVGAQAEGYHPKMEEVVVLKRGGDGAHTIKLVKRESPDKPKKVEKGKVPDKPADKEAERDRTSLYFQWGIIGSGLAMLAAGGICTGISANRNSQLHDDYPPDPAHPENEENYNDAYDADVVPVRNTSWVLYGIGGATTAAGLAWLIANGVAGKSDSPVSFAPMLGPHDTVGATVGWYW